MQEEKYVGNRVIEHGHRICEEWNSNKYTSRKVVDSVRTAVDSAYAKPDKKARVLALAYIFALDLRIKERYGSIIRCLFSYFSWKRETALLKWAKGRFKMAGGVDIRDAIEVELKRIREDMDMETDDESDESNGGGKTQQVSTDNGTVKKNDQTTNVSDEEIAQNRSENKKSTETSSDKESEELRNDNVVEKVEKVEEHTGGQKEPAKDSTETHKNVTVSESVEFRKSNAGEYKENKTENIGSVETEEPLKDKKQINYNYYDVIDPIPVTKEKKSKSSEERSYIDEIVLDNLVKYKTNVGWSDPMREANQEVSQDVLRDRVQDKGTSRVDPNKNDKESYLLDKMMEEIKGDALRNNSTVPQKNEQVNVKANDARMQIRIDDQISMENEFRREINDQFNEKMVLVHKAMMENAMKAEIIVLSAAYENEAPAEVVDRIHTVHQHEAISIRK